jgi:hypothetical protein
VSVGQVRFNNAAQDKWAQKINVALRRIEAQAAKAQKSADYAATVGGTTNTTIINEGGTNPDEVIEAPTAPENFEAKGGFSSIFLQWDMPDYQGHNFTRIYRSSTNAFGDAVWIADVFGKLHSDLDVGHYVGFYYWAKHVNKNGVESAIHDVAGAYAITARSYDYVIEEAKADVLEALAVWQGGVGEALDILDNKTLGLITDTADTIETLSRNVTIIENNALAKYDETITTVNSTVGTAVTKVETLAATLYETDGEGQLMLDENGNPIFRGAFIDRVDAVMAAEDGALMAAIGETLSLVQTDGTRYSLSEIMELAVDTDGRLTGQWGIKTSIDDILYGVGLAYFTDDEGEQRVGFHVAAHTFAVYNPANGEEVFPLIVNDAGEVLIDTAIIDTATITTLIAETIITEELFATKTIKGPIIEAGEFFGGSININDNFIVNTSGYAFAKGLTIYDDAGDVVLNSSGVDGTYINDLSVDTLKIKKNAVTVQSFSETDTVDIAKGGSGVMWSTSHPHDGQHASGSIMLNILIEAIRTTGGGADDQITFTVEVFETSFYTVLQTHPPVTVGWPENANTSFFTPIIMYVPDVTQDAVRVKVSAVSAGEAHTISMRVVASSAKR